MKTDQWGGIEIEEPQTDEWGGIAVEEAAAAPSPIAPPAKWDAWTGEASPELKAIAPWMAPQKVEPPKSLEPVQAGEVEQRLGPSPETKARDLQLELLRQATEKAAAAAQRELTKDELLKLGENAARAVDFLGLAARAPTKEGILGDVGKAIIPAGEAATAAAFEQGLNRLAEDVAQGDLTFPRFQNAMAAGKRQAGYSTLEKGAADLTSILPDMALSAAGQAYGIPATATFGTLSAARAAAEGGSPQEIQQAGVVGALVPGAGHIGSDLAVKTLKGAISRGLLSADRIAVQKAAEAVGSQLGFQSFFAGLSVPEVVAMPPEKRAEFLIEQGIKNLVFTAMDLPKFKRGTPSETLRELVQERDANARLATGKQLRPPATGGTPISSGIAEGQESPVNPPGAPKAPERPTIPPTPETPATAPAAVEAKALDADMDSARRVAKMSDQEFMQAGGSFNKTNVRLGENATAEQVAELKELHSEARKELQAVLDKADKGTATIDDINRLGALQGKVQYFSEAIQAAPKEIGGIGRGFTDAEKLAQSGGKPEPAPVPASTLGGPSRLLPPEAQAIEAANKAEQMRIAEEFKAKLAARKAAEQPAAPTPAPAAGKGLAGEVRRRLEAGEKPGAEAGGGVPMHELVYDFGKSIYAKGMKFADWAARMVKELGEKAKDWLDDIWLNIVHGPPADPHAVARDIGFTHNPERQIGPMREKGLTKEEISALRAAGHRPNWEFTDRREKSGEVTDTPGYTFYTRVGASKAEILDHLNAGRKARGLAPVGEARPITLELEAGAGIPIPRGLDQAIKKTRDTIRTLAKTKGVRSIMAYTKDVAGNTATVYGQRIGNNVRGELRRAMGRGTKPNILDENALTFVRESNGDRGQLNVMRGKILASNAASPKWKSAVIKAIDHADANWDRLNPIASQYAGATDAQIAAENAAGINTLSRKGYVMHAQDVQNDFGFFGDVAGEGSTGFKHARAYDTFADSIAAGIDPKSINAVTLLTQRVARGQMLINNRMWVEGLKTTIDPKTRKSVITEPEVVPRGPGLPPDVRAPTDYVTEIAGGRPIAILKPYAGIFRALTEPSKFSESLGWNAALKAATTGKHVALMLDTFHLGRIALWQSIIKPLSLTDPKLPLPSYKNGVLTLDYTRAELQRMAAAGEIDPRKLNALLDAKREIDGLVKHGYNVAKISDQLHQEWLQKIPITGHFNQWLFNQFQRGAMAEVGSLEVGRYRRMHPSWSDEQVYREVAKDLNTRFGNLGRQGLLKSKTAMDTARLLFLAPQWNEGLIRSELGAISGIAKGIGSSIKERRLSFGILPRAVGAMLLGQFAANQIINYITRGKPTWENEEEGMGAKLSAWVPDVVGDGPGFFLHPAGLAAEITHLLSSKYEKKGDVRDAIMGFMGGRWSTLARPVMTFLNRRDVFQRLIRPENIWKETAKAAFPAPIGASAAVPAIKQQITGEKKELFPGQYQKQLMASMGIKTDQAPSPNQRMRALAGEFRKSKGIESSGEFYESAYVPLRQALQRGAVKEARQAYDDLIKSDHKPKQIEDAVKPWTGGNLNRSTLEISPRHPKPFSGSSKHEAEFLKALTPEQRNVAKAAYEELVKTFKLFREMLKSTPSETDEFGGIPVE